MEIAAIHESRGGDLGVALAALARAWRIEPTRHDVFDQLTALGARMGAWDALCQTLAFIPANPDYSSLNLGSAVQVFAYEMRVAAGAAAGFEAPQFQLATQGEIDAMLG